MKQLYSTFLLVFMLISCSPIIQEAVNYTPIGTFQLASPQLVIDSIVFQKAATIKLELAHPNVQIRYTLDGSEVHKQSKLYTNPIMVKEAGTVKVKAFHPDFKSSKTVSQDFLKIKKLSKDTEIFITPQPHKNYPGNGAKSLIDLQKGTTDFKNAKVWSGFQTKEITIDLTLKAPQDITAISLSLLEDHGAWIFLPERIEIYSIDESSTPKLLSTKALEIPKKAAAPKVKFITQRIASENNPIQKLQIKIISLTNIPDFHTGKGTPPWLFIDEIMFE